MTDHATSASQNDDGLRDKKLKLAGMGYIVGDLAGVVTNVAKGKKTNLSAMAGFSTWLAGGVAAAHYGNPDAEKRLEIVATKLQSHLKRHGVDIPSDVRAQSALLKEKTFLQKLDSFFYEHPSEMLNASYAAGAGMFLHQGIKQAGTHSLLPGTGKDLNAKFWMGALVMTGALIGLFAKEKETSNETEESKKGLLSFITEKPLRVSAALYTANNGFLLVDALNDRKAHLKGQHTGALKPHYFSFLTLASYVFSNSLLFMSSRNQLGKAFSSSDIAQLEDASARIIAAQPVQVQQTLLADLSRYIAEQKGVGQDAPHIAQALANRLTELTGERAQQAANQVSWTAREAKRAAAPTQQNL